MMLKTYAETPRIVLKRKASALSTEKASTEKFQPEASINAIESKINKSGALAAKLSQRLGTVSKALSEAETKLEGINSMLTSAESNLLKIINEGMRKKAALYRLYRSAIGESTISSESKTRNIRRKVNPAELPSSTKVTSPSSSASRMNTLTLLMAGNSSS